MKAESVIGDAIYESLSHDVTTYAQAALAALRAAVGGGPVVIDEEGRLLGAQIADYVRTPHGYTHGIQTMPDKRRPLWRFVEVGEAQ